MKKCKHCNLYINTERKTCPFCRNTLEIAQEKIMDVVYQPFPPYSERELKKKTFVYRFFLFLTIITMITSVAINYYTYKDNPQLWSFIVIIGLLLAWSFIRGMIISKENFGRRLGLFSLLLCVLFFVIELLTPAKGWTINYMVPFIFIATLATLTFSVFVNPNQYQNYVIYFFLFSLFALIPYLLYLWGVVTVKWPSITGALYAISTILGMFFFAGKKTIEEIKKRIHI